MNKSEITENCKKMLNTIAKSILELPRFDVKVHEDYRGSIFNIVFFNTNCWWIEAKSRLVQCPLSVHTTFDSETHIEVMPMNEDYKFSEEVALCSAIACEWEDIKKWVAGLYGKQQEDLNKIANFEVGTYW